MSWRVFIIASATLLLGVIAGLFIRITATSAALTMSAAVDEIKTCEKQSNMIACSRPIIDKLLESTNIAGIMDGLQASFPPEACHYIGHIVGQQAYIKSKNLEQTLSECSRTCDSACVHGAIGEVFAEQIGLGTPEDDQNIDLEHLSIADMQTMGKRLCANAEACHGVGHAIFQGTRDMAKAMDVCKGTTQNYVTSCYNGAAMEYADILGDRNMRDVPGVKLPDVKTVADICTAIPDLVQQRSCFRYFPRMVIATLKTQGLDVEHGYEKVLSICNSYPTIDQKTACFLGIGAFSAYYIITDQDKAVAACKGLPGSIQNEAACYFGEVAVAVEERQDKLFQFCPKLPNPTLQRDCFQQVFYYLDRFHALSSSTPQLCPAGDASCEQGYKNMNLSPWNILFKNFPK